MFYQSLKSIGWIYQGGFIRKAIAIDVHARMQIMHTIPTTMIAARVVLFVGCFSTGPVSLIAVLL